MEKREYPETTPTPTAVITGPTRKPEDPNEPITDVCGGEDAGFTEPDCDNEPVAWSLNVGFCPEHFRSNGYRLADFGVEKFEELPDEWTHPSHLTCPLCDEVWHAELDNERFSTCPECRRNE